MTFDPRRPWDAFYTKTTPQKPKPAAVDNDGWRALEGGGWERVASETNGVSGLVRSVPTAPARAAEVFYGDNRKTT